MANDTTTSPFITANVVGCPSLEQSGLVLSTANSTNGVTVGVSCDEFGHRPSSDTDALRCLDNGTWDRPVPHCEWSWDFKTEDKIVFWTSVGAVSFLIVVVIAVVLAYFCCYKKRKESEDRLYGSSTRASSPQLGLDGPYAVPASLYASTTDPYLAYHQNGTEKYDGYTTNGSMPDKMWLGYIPRPKVSEGRIY